MNTLAQHPNHKILIYIFISAITLTVTSCMNKSDKTPLNPQDIRVSDIKPDYDPGPGYQLKWADEFTGETIDANNWNHQVEPAGRFNDEWQRYTSSKENAYIENGCMVIKVIHESDKHGMDQYTSARMNTANKQSWKYGKIVARVKLPYSKGMWPAFWMLGANINENGGDTPWPQCGEIDIFELYGSKDDSVVEANIHYADASGAHNQMGAKSYHLNSGKFADGFHIFELEWDGEKVSWSVDGEGSL